MADTDHTLGYRFAESKFYAKTYTSHSTDQFVINNESLYKHGHNNSPYTDSPPLINQHLIDAPIGNTIDTTLAELLETLRLHVHNMLRLPLSVQTRSRMVRIYCDIESRTKEMRLLLNPVDIAAALALLDVLQNQPGPINSP